MIGLRSSTLAYLSKMPGCRPLPRRTVRYRSMRCRPEKEEGAGCHSLVSNPSYDGISTRRTAPRCMPAIAISIATGTSCFPSVMRSASPRSLFVGSMPRPSE